MDDDQLEKIKKLVGGGFIGRGYKRPITVSIAKTEDGKKITIIYKDYTRHLGEMVITTGQQVQVTATEDFWRFKRQVEDILVEQEVSTSDCESVV